MRVFVTGGMGYLGSHLVKELVRIGDEVTILARNPDKVPSLRDHPQVTIVQGGLDDKDVIWAALAGHNACIHNAIYWEDEPTELELKDTRAAILVFEGAAEAGVDRLLYTSSTSANRPLRPNMTEEMRLTPTDFYGATKAAGEAFLSAFSYLTPMRCNVIRPGPTVGPPAFPGGPFHGDRRFMPILAAARAGEPVRVNRNEGRQFVGADDVARTYAAVLHSDQNRETYLAVGEDFMTWESIAQATIDLLGSSSPILLEEAGFASPPPLFHTDKLRNAFGLSFRSDLAMQEHLRHLITQP